MKRIVVLLMLFALASCGKHEQPPQFRLYGPASGGDKTMWRLHEKERAQRAAEYGER